MPSRASWPSNDTTTTGMPRSSSSLGMAEPAVTAGKMTPSTRRPTSARTCAGLGLGIVLGLGHQHREPVAVRAPLDLERQRGVERVERVRDRDAQRARRLALQRARHLVLAVAELLDRLQHAQPRVLGHRRGVVQHVGDGRHRDAGAAGDVAHGRAHAPAPPRQRGPQRRLRVEDALLGVEPRDPRARSRRRRRSRRSAAQPAAATTRPRRGRRRPRRSARGRCPDRPGSGSRRRHGRRSGRGAAACPCRGRSRSGRRAGRSPAAGRCPATRSGWGRS